MSLINKHESLNSVKEVQKEIEVGILKAIADISNEDDWPEGADADDIQSIITQLARSAAHLRDTSRIENEKKLLKQELQSR
ncbi:MAG TPA: hypothetical protein VMX55_12060 [candidate division Zixibacteria bacterium]|nr:hypothetical protein [candidate division Zixibacteria bacterium]